MFIAVLATLACAAFFAGSEAAAQSAGGISPGSGGSSGGGSSGGGQTSTMQSSQYAQIWSATPAREKRWARATSQCESGGNPNAIGGGGTFRGAFQFMKSTWRTSPKSPGGDPITYDYRTQAVVAIMLKKRDGAGHWPVCG